MLDVGNWEQAMKNCIDIHTYEPQRGLFDIFNGQTAKCIYIWRVQPLHHGNQTRRARPTFT